MPRLESGARNPKSLQPSKNAAKGRAPLSLPMDSRTASKRPSPSAFGSEGCQVRLTGGRGAGAGLVHAPVRLGPATAGRHGRRPGTPTGRGYGRQWRIELQLDCARTASPHVDSWRWTVAEKKRGLYTVTVGLGFVADILNAAPKSSAQGDVGSFHRTHGFKHAPP